jgi:hypothetical protein
VVPEIDRMFGAASQPGLMGFVTLDAPSWMPAREASQVRDDDLVFGVVTEDGAHCLPFYVVDYYHTVNTTFGDLPVVLVSCDRCGTAGAWIARAPDGRQLVFRNWGILQAQLVWRDEATDSIWAHSEATAIHGELHGVTLDPLGVVLVQTFGEWRERYPDSLVLAEVTHDRSHRDMRHGHGREEVFERPGIGLHEREHFFGSLTGAWDERRPEQEMVLGVCDPAGRAAYPWREVKHEGNVVHDDLGGVPIAVWCDPAPDGVACAAFDRRVEGQVLDFVVDDRTFVDGPTGSRWELDGRCVDGPLAGRRLAPLRSCFKRWFSWGASNPGVPVFTSPRRSSGDTGWGVDVGALAPLVDGLRGTGADVVLREEVVRAALPQGCSRGVLLEVDGDPAWLWECATRDHARDLAALRRELLTLPHAIAHDRFVLEDACMDRWSEWTHTQLRPEAEIPWSRRLAHPATAEAFARAAAAMGPSRPPVGALTDVLVALADRGYGSDPERTRLLPPSARAVGCEAAAEVFLGADRLILSRWESAPLADAGAAADGHCLVEGPFVLRSTPVNMYRLRAMEMIVRGERNTRWSPLLDDEAFLAGLRDAVRLAPTAG